MDLMDNQYGKREAVEGQLRAKLGESLIGRQTDLPDLFKKRNSHKGEGVSSCFSGGFKHSVCRVG